MMILSQRYSMLTVFMYIGISMAKKIRHAASSWIDCQSPIRETLGIHYIGISMAKTAGPHHPRLQLQCCKNHNIKNN